MPRLRVFVLAVFVLAMGWNPAGACDCTASIRNDRDEAAHEFKEARTVFEGEVLSVERPSQSDSCISPTEATSMIPCSIGLREITFRVLRKYKGAQEDIVRINSVALGADCSADVKVGEKWFIYGLEGDNGKLYIAACSRSNWLQAAGADVRYSRGEPATDEDLIPPDERAHLASDPTLVNRGATLSGQVRRPDGQNVSDETVLTLWELDKDGQRTGDKTVSQQVHLDGKFTVRHVPPGSYFLAAEDRDWTTNTRFIRNFGRVDFTEKSYVSNLEIVLEPDPLAPITVSVEPREALRSGMWVMLTDSEFGPSNTRLFMDRETADLSKNGVAHFDKMPYASYNVEVGVSGLPRRLSDTPIPGWCQAETKVKLDGSPATVTVLLHKCSDK
jgi:hypothetical protein